MDKRLTLIRFWMVFGFVALAAGNVRSEEDESDECSGTDGGGTSRIQVAQSSETREECIRKVINYWTRVLIPNDIKLFVTEARQYYDQPEAVDGDYEVPERPKSCKTLKKALSCQLKRAVPCWNNPRITGHISKHEALLDLMKTEDMREAERRYIKALHENNYACKHGRNSGKAMRDDGVFSLFENWQNEQEIPNVSREQCMEQVTKYWESLLSVVTPDIEDRVEEARQYYGHTERLPGYLEPLETETCRVLTDAMEERGRKIPCWSYAHITGDWRQAMKEVLSKSIDTRAGMEAVYACDFGLNAGPMLRERQFFDAVVDWQFAHVKSRDECLQQFANYWDSQEPLADDIKARVARASKYYDEVERIFGYVRPLPTESCVKLDDKMYYESGKAVPCWKSVLVMGDDTTQDWIDACKASIALRKAKEAEYACDHGDNAGLVMKEHGLFGAVVLGEYDESDSDEGQSLSDNEEENYSDSDE